MRLELQCKASQALERTSASLVIIMEALSYSHFPPFSALIVRVGTMPFQPFHFSYSATFLSQEIHFRYSFCIRIHDCFPRWKKMFSCKQFFGAWIKDKGLFCVCCSIPSILLSFHFNVHQIKVIQVFLKYSAPSSPFIGPDL